MVEQLKVLEWVHQEKLMKYTDKLLSTKYFRKAFDSGNYIRVGELSPQSSKKDLQKTTP